MVHVATMPGMGKKTRSGRPSNPLNQNLATLYVEIPIWLKTALQNMATADARTIKAMVTIILKQEAERQGYSAPIDE